MLAKTWYNLFKKNLKNNILLYGYKIIFHYDFNLHFPNDYARAFDCVDHNKLWKILKEMGISEHLTCLLRNPYTGQEAIVRTGHGTIDWFQIRKADIKALYCHLTF